MARSYTPGPWGVEISRRGTLCVASETTWICGVLQATNSTSIADAEAEANAHLIAAAPELFEALKELVGYFPTILPSKGVLPNAKIERARAALSKATHIPAIKEKV